MQCAAMDEAGYFRDKARECRALASLAIGPVVVAGLLRLAREFEMQAIKADIRAMSGGKPNVTA
jgi:hypothetical protein